MKKIARKILITFLFTFLVIVISGCHGAKVLDPFVLPLDFDSSRDYEITFWAKNDSNNTQQKIYSKAIDDFEKIYPNIKVNIVQYADYGTIYNDVITNINTRTTPNICISYPDHVATYLSGTNIVVPLDDLFNSEKYGLGGSEILYTSIKKGDIVNKFLEECKFNGYYYTMPFMRSTEACYINKDYVESLGFVIPEVLTWDFVWEVSEYAMTKKEDGKVLIPFIYKSTDNMMIQMIKQKDGEYSDADGSIKIFNDTTKSLLETIALHSKSRCFSTFKISSYPGNFYNAGQCIFAIDSTAGSTWLGTEAPLMEIPKDTVASFETVVRTIPQFDVSNPKMISQGPSICIFNKEDPQEVLASWLFTQYLLTNDVQIAYSKTEGYVPVTKVAQESDEYKDYLSRAGEVIVNDKGVEDKSTYYDVKINAVKLLLDNIENTFVTPVFNGSASLRDSSGQMIEKVVRSVRKGEVIDDDYIDNLYSDMISLYRLDQINTSNNQKADLGKLPNTSSILIGSLVVIWILLVIYVIVMKKKNNTKVD